jgi:hypothetical protein
MLHVYHNFRAFREMECKQEDFERTVASIPQWEADFQLFVKGVLIFQIVQRKSPHYALQAY